MLGEVVASRFTGSSSNTAALLFSRLRNDDLSISGAGGSSGSTAFSRARRREGSGPIFYSVSPTASGFALGALLNMLSEHKGSSLDFSAFMSRMGVMCLRGQPFPSDILNVSKPSKTKLMTDDAERFLNAHSELLSWVSSAKFAALRAFPFAKLRFDVIEDPDSGFEKLYLFISPVSYEGAWTELEGLLGEVVASSRDEIRRRVGVSLG